MNLDMLYRQAWDLFMRHRYNESLGIVVRGLSHDRENYRLLSLKANLLSALDKAEEERRCYEQMRKIFPDRAIGYWGRAELLVSEGKYSQAIKWFAKALALLRRDEKDLALVLFHGYAEALHRSGLNRRALAMLSRGLRHHAVGDKKLLRELRTQILFEGKR